MTTGEADGPAGKYTLIAALTPASDIIANTNAATNFASQVTLTGLGIAVGDVIRVRARGVYGTAALATSLLVRLTNSGNQLLTNTAANVTPNLTDRGWSLEANLIALVGNSECQGTLVTSTSSTASQTRDMQNTSNTGTDVQNGTLQIEVTWGTADALNTITLRQLIVERLAA